MSQRSSFPPNEETVEFTLVGREAINFFLERPRDYNSFVARHGDGNTIQERFVLQAVAQNEEEMHNYVLFSQAIDARDAEAAQMRRVADISVNRNEKNIKVATIRVMANDPAFDAIKARLEYANEKDPYQSESATNQGLHFFRHELQAAAFLTNLSSKAKNGNERTLSIRVVKPASADCKDWRWELLLPNGDGKDTSLGFIDMKEDTGRLLLNKEHPSYQLATDIAKKAIANPMKFGRMPSTMPVLFGRELPFHNGDLIPATERRTPSTHGLEFDLLRPIMQKWKEGEDIKGEEFLELYEQLEQYDSHPPPQSWLIEILMSDVFPSKPRSSTLAHRQSNPEPQNSGRKK